jgi:hypothetical protein
MSCDAAMDRTRPSTIKSQKKIVGGLAQFAIFLAILLIASSVALTQDTPNPIPTPSITLAPLSVTLAPGGSQQFEAFIPAGGAVKWYVNGIEGGNISLFGSITPTGLYKAPSAKDAANMPTMNVLITVKSSVNDNMTASATLVIVLSSCLVGGQPCIQITGAQRPSEPIFSEIVSPDDEVYFTGKVVNAMPETNVSWTVNSSSTGDSTIGQIVEMSGAVGRYRAPHSPPPPTITINVTATATIRPSLTISSVVQILIVPPVLFHCSAEAPLTTRCSILKFNRLKGQTGAIWESSSGHPELVDEHTDAGYVSAINSSKALFVGSIVSVHLTDGANNANCTNYDWKFVVQAEESASIFIYEAADVGSGICEGDRFIIALPVYVIWVDVFGYPEHRDPSRTAPGKPSSYTDCFGASAPQTITPCDKNSSWRMSTLYNTGWFWDHLNPPGTGQGSISLGWGQGSSFDIQADPALKLGSGWINIPVLFERAAAPSSNLNALSFAVAYDFRWLRNPNFGQASENSIVVFRKPQFRVQSGPEMAPSAPHDWNFIVSETVKFPVVINYNRYGHPSYVTIYPVIGAEEGSHLATHLTENQPILRGMAGVDASLRWPYSWTHNFFGTTPVTINAQYRVRWLVYSEPTAEVSRNLPETLSRQQHSFFKGTITIPLDPYIQLNPTVLVGSLPPTFRIINTTFSLALSFSNPGGIEH